MTLYPA